MKCTLLTLVLIFFSGCATPALLVLKNKSDNNAVYRIVTKDCLKVRDLTISPKSKIHVWIGGFMDWKEENIERYTDKIQYIEIISQNDSIRLTGRNEMFKYIKSKRNFSNQTVKIVIE